MSTTGSADLPHPSDNVTPLPYQEKFNKNRPHTKFVDPCEKAAKASYACMDKNDYDRDSCSAYFAAYRECKRTWMAQLKADRRAGLID
ncbi:coiled-coil-helix-coiled-coil-helix domain-containing protein [Phanerochaete sordida]|uniref:Coiled-coil-helix-coiled-coil-helix domain-containing protein n=1 Tax=Phanerochaete sordida TaxID=48140 RepID=A0A9P3LEI2_9APHY|nr:coiled-coil-helix-coiled-coil-helix domain-containing protein [Phanerochaete sordida]